MRPIVLGALLLLSSPALAATPAKGRVVREAIPAPALEGNPAGDPARIDSFVYLPANYDKDSKRRFPVVYLLTGFATEPEEWMGPAPEGAGLPTRFDELFASGALPPAIIVLPSARNRFVSSFWRNSTATGRWEDALVEDVVRHVDAHYRTRAEAGGRALVGHSMGGYAALALAARHPEVFAAAYGLSPCCLVPEGEFSPTEHAEAWKKLSSQPDLATLDRWAREGDFHPMLYMAVAAVFSPAPGRSPLPVDLPYTVQDGSLRENRVVLERWRDEMLLNLLEREVRGLERLRTLGFDVGDEDAYSSIRQGVPRLSEKLSRLGVPHSYELFRGNHFNRLLERLDTVALPRVLRALVEPPKARERKASPR